MSTYDPTKTQAERQADYRASIAATAERGDVLDGHTSPETAYLVDDYPYGFRLRCQIRYWLEHKPRHGFRLVSQTTNPKRPSLVWNKPKAGTYHACAVMVLDDEGHVHLHTIEPGGWSEWETVDAFEEHYAAALTDAHREAIRFIRATIKAGKVLTVTVTTNSDEPRQTREEQDAIFCAALAYG